MIRRRLPASVCMVAAFALFAMAVLEISFPETFSLAFRFPGLVRLRMQIGAGEAALSALLLWPAFRLDPRLSAKLLETASRLGLGGMFVFASWFKIQDPQQFAMLVAQYQFLPNGSVNLFALFMPQLELWTGLALVFTPRNREAALLLLCMFAAFIVALGQAVVRNLGITCGCFELAGAMDKRDAWSSLVRDLVLLAPTAWLALRPNRTLLGIWKDRT